MYVTETPSSALTPSLNIELLVEFVLILFAFNITPEVWEVKLYKKAHPQLIVFCVKLSALFWQNKLLIPLRQLICRKICKYSLWTGQLHYSLYWTNRQILCIVCLDFLIIDTVINKNQCYLWKYINNVSLYRFLAPVVE